MVHTVVVLKPQLLAKARGRRRWLIALAVILAATIAPGWRAHGGLAGQLLAPRAVRAVTMPVAPGVGATSIAPVRIVRTVLRIATGDPAPARRPVVVLTPRVPGAGTLPVVFLLHGLPGGANDLCSAPAAAHLAAAITAGAQPVIMACPDGSTTDGRDTEWADTADGAVHLERFVTGPVIAAVEGSHHRSRAERAIGGYSMGGFGAAAIGLRHPDLYGQVVALAGYFHLDDPDGAFAADDVRRHVPDDLIGRASMLRWFLDDGQSDQTQLTRAESARYATLLQANGARVELVQSSGDHTPAWAVSQLPAVIGFLSHGWYGRASGGGKGSP
jgi:S-formylglutathione hydrolase FrmB